MKQQLIAGFRHLVSAAQTSLARLRRDELSPERFARSIAVGLALGLTPLFGFQSLLWAGLVLVLPVDPLLTWLSSWVGNAATAVPILWLELEIGSLVLSGRRLGLSWQQLGEGAALCELGRELALGAFLLVSSAGLAAYFLTLAWLHVERRRRLRTRAF